MIKCRAPDHHKERKQYQLNEVVEKMPFLLQLCMGTNQILLTSFVFAN